MKICPTCQTEFIDGSMRFCTKDGTPLITFTPPVMDEPPIPTLIPTPEPPSLDATLSDIPFSRNQFTDAPSFDPAVRLDPDSDFDSDIDSDFSAAEESNKFNVEVDEPQVVQPMTPIPIPATTTTDAAPDLETMPPSVAAAPPKRKSKAALFVVLGVLGLFGLLGIVGAAGVYLYFSSDKQVTTVVNTNANTENVNDVAANDNADEINDNNNLADTNTNDNENSDANLDANLDTNLNVNGIAGINANTRPSPTPRSSPSPRNTNRNANQVIEIEPSQPTPTPVRQTPTPPLTSQGSKTVAGGVVNGRATSLPKPPYPAAARAVRAEGQVNVQVLIDENGNVVSASAISGNPLLRQAAAQAARQAKFSRTVISGQPVKVSGVIIYNFTMN